MNERGWDQADVVFVTGDAYIDHASFAMAILGRVLEAAGFRVGIVSQPDWQSCNDWKRFGRPRLFFAISAGNMDSMINHYTANRKVRNDDAYSPGGRIGMRPDRATLAYCQRAREAYKGCTGDRGRRRGISAALSALRLLERQGPAIDPHWTAKRTCSHTAWARSRLSRSPGAWMRERPSETCATCAGSPTRSALPSRRPKTLSRFPSYEEVRSDKRAFAEATRIIHNETNPFNARRLVQRHDRQAVVCNPPPFPISEAAMDAIYGLPYTRQLHPSYDRAPCPRSR